MILTHRKVVRISIPIYTVKILSNGRQCVYQCRGMVGLTDPCTSEPPHSPGHDYILIVLDGGCKEFFYFHGWTRGVVENHIIIKINSYRDCSLRVFGTRAAFFPSPSLSLRLFWPRPLLGQPRSVWGFRLSTKGSPNGKSIFVESAWVDIIWCVAFLALNNLPDFSSCAADHRPQAPR